ncbi:MAG: hypothetical protein SPJ13_02985 [Bacteroidales bacterium]|nr:hypothetical protein [Bacteroidales bacterium]
MAGVVMWSCGELFVVRWKKNAEKGCIFAKVIVPKWLFGESEGLTHVIEENELLRKREKNIRTKIFHL